MDIEYFISFLEDEIYKKRLSWQVIKTHNVVFIYEDEKHETCLAKIAFFPAPKHFEITDYGQDYARILNSIWEKYLETMALKRNEENVGAGVLSDDYAKINIIFITGSIFGCVLGLAGFISLINLLN